MSFAVVRDGLAWRVENYFQVRVKSDPWPGSERLHILFPVLIQTLHSQGIYHLNQIVDQGHTSIHIQEWLVPDHINLEGENVTQWSNYIQALKSAHVWIVDREDDFIGSMHL